MFAFMQYNSEEFKKIKQYLRILEALGDNENRNLNRAEISQRLESIGLNYKEVENKINDMHHHNLLFLNNKNDGIFRAVANGKEFYKIQSENIREIEEEHNKNEETRILVNDVNKSTINTNKSFIKLNWHQKLNMWLTLMVAVFASWVAYNQFVNDEKRDAREVLRKEDAEQIKYQMQITNMSLDSMRVLQIEANARLDSFLKTSTKTLPVQNPKK